MILSRKDISLGLQLPRSFYASRKDDDTVEEAVASTNGDVAEQSIEPPATNDDDDEEDVLMGMESSKEPGEDNSDLVVSKDTASINKRSLESTTMEPRKKSDNSSRVDRRVRDGVSLLASRKDDDAVEEAFASTNGDVAN